MLRSFDPEKQDQKIAAYRSAYKKNRIRTPPVRSGGAFYAGE
ncbi:hypothetical protein DEU51_11425 [Pseudomonas jessenii]|uniref:Uncharacterized protein n=1 Tax=Pseudomonas jessenii TaxID=77298 RepID=A0A370S8T1_PSEJE|nr:hypothetical protein DEU51_11425 [Pseudomonas jessenii]